MHRFRQPGLGTLGEPLHGLLVLLSRAVHASQSIHGVHVPLPRRLHQKRRALLRQGLATANESFDQTSNVPRSHLNVVLLSDYACQTKLVLARGGIKLS